MKRFMALWFFVVSIIGMAALSKSNIEGDTQAFIALGLMVVMAISGIVMAVKI